MNKKQIKSILKKYLGISPVWFDLRKREILNDNLDINQWQINMNYLIYRYGTIDACEQKAFERWTITFEDTGTEEIDFVEYLEERVTPVLLNMEDGNLPSVLHKGQDRNWFLAAYPHVFAYFFPQPNYLAEDFDAEMRRFEEHVQAVKPEHERMLEYITQGKGNQTIYLVRMKIFYRMN